MKKNVLYLMEMGSDLKEIKTNVKNCRVRVLENIDILYKGKVYSMFFEFLHGTHWHYRTENLRNGKPLKKPVYTVDLVDGVYLDTQFEELQGTWQDGTPYYASYRNSALEKEFYNEHHEYTKKDILEIVNRYKIGEKFTEVCLVETRAKEIIKSSGGWRELDILGEGRDFRTEGDSYFERGETWNDEHKIMRCNKRAWVECDNGKARKLEVVDFCEVDLITGRITG